MEAENSNEMHQSPVASECGKLNDHGLCNKHLSRTPEKHSNDLEQEGKGDERDKRCTLFNPRFELQ